MKLKQISVFVENKPGTVGYPCKVLADAGINITLRCPSPREIWYCLNTINAVYSPAAPELGWRLTPAKPVMIFSSSQRLWMSS